jgi:imidazoleglycerol-phosphate dehydratase
MAAVVPRSAEISRRTAETRILCRLALDGSGEARVATGVGFFDHMLTALAKHALLDLDLTCEGDLAVDMHHTVEDCGIVLGQALKAALGEKRGIRRYGHAILPMDEARVQCALDISGRPYLAWEVTFARDKVGEMDTELFEEFFRALAFQSGLTLHLTMQAGSNQHHIAEACFKAVARALRMAAEPDPRIAGAIPSTKGTLGG